MSMLFLRYGLKHHLLHKFRLSMVVISLALGVAIFVSSYESVMAAQTAIAASANAFSSKAEWQVSRGQALGMGADVLRSIRQLPGAIAAPIIEASATTDGLHPANFLVVGLDLDSDSTAKLYGGSLDSDLMAFVKLRLTGSGIVVPRAFAASHGLSEGSELSLQTSHGAKNFTVAGILESKKLDGEAGGSVGFMDVAEAVRDFGKPGMVDKIEVSGVSKVQLESTCPACIIERPGKLGSAADDALARIRSLLGISMIAMLVGLLLIYNSVQVSVLERLKDIAILKAIGATRLQVFLLLLSEWLVIGLVSSGLGVLLGSVLAYSLLEYTKRTVNTMVPLVAEARVSVGPVIVLGSMAIGTVTALAAACLPVWAASNVRPLEILRPYTYRRTQNYSASAWVGLAMFVVANLVIATESVSYAIGLSVTGIEFFGVALMFPQIVLATGRRLRKTFRNMRDPWPYLALDSMLKAPHRTAFTMMTFGCALMMTVATKTLVAGFQASTGMWMSSAFPFDISVMGNDLASSVYGSQTLSPALTGQIRKLAGVSNAYSVRKLFTPYRGQDVMAIGVETRRYLAARKNKAMGMWPTGLSDSRIRTEFESGGGTFVSNNFAQLYGARTGQSIALDTPSGTRRFKVLGEVDDYSWQHGAFIIDYGQLERIWKDDAVSYIDLSAAPGFTLGDVKRRVQSVAAASRQAFAYDTKEIRDVTDSVLEQTVAMANLQAVIAVVIGVLGVVNAIWIGVMNRKREIALWRSIGVTRSQVVRIVLVEGVAIAAMAAVVGAVGGLYGGWFPLRSFSFNVTGYLYPMVVPWIHLGLTSVMALVLGLLAGLLPARQAAGLPILDSIGYE